MRASSLWWKQLQQLLGSDADATIHGLHFALQEWEQSFESPAQNDLDRKKILGHHPPI